MDFSENYDNLKRTMWKGRKFTHYNYNSPILSFVHRGDRASVKKDGFYHVIGHLSRNLLGFKWDSDLSKEAISNLVDIPEINGDDDKIVFEGLLNEYLYKEDSHIKVTHPSLYRYVPPSYTLQKQYTDKTYGERKLALFFKDVFFKSPEKGMEFFSKDEFNNDIFKFILLNYDLKTDDIKMEYYPILNNIVDLFNEDFEFLLNYESYLMENLENFFAFYYFFYSTQLLLKLTKDFSFFKDENSIEKVYYLLETENAHEYRQAVYEGFNLLKVAVNEALCKIYVIDHINTLIGQHDYMLGDIFSYFENDLPDSDKEDLYSCLFNWVEYYRDINDLEKKDLPDTCTGENFKELINTLFSSMYDDDGVPAMKTTRYPLNLYELGNAFQLIKFRGQYGFTLNMSNDMLLLLTALSVKTETNMNISELFEKFKDRGIFFDDESQAEVLDFLDKRNLIDKKSDSEEGTYVRPIL